MIVIVMININDTSISYKTDLLKINPSEVKILVPLTDILCPSTKIVMVT